MRSSVPTHPFIEFEKDEIERCIPDRFERQVTKYPHRLAVKTKDHALTYDALNRAANRLARDILEKRGEGEEPILLLLDNGARQ
jgi:surfactin family lipopeptide synthetase A